MSTEPEPGTAAGRQEGDSGVDAEDRPTPAPPAPASAGPLLPAQSREDTDVGWGDYADAGDNDRLLRDRPPHWDNG